MCTCSRSKVEGEAQLADLVVVVAGSLLEVLKSAEDSIITREDIDERDITSVGEVK